MRIINRFACGCVVAVLLLLVTVIVLLVLLFAKEAHAASAGAPLTQTTGDAPTYDILLVSDQSISMWECDGVGSDPDLLRVDAVHLFINYLGADSSRAHYRLGLLHFGGVTQQMAPLTDVGSEATRRQLATVADAPKPIPWTNPLLALQTAQDILTKTAQPDSRRVVVLLTDGEPAWPDDKPMRKELYQTELQRVVEEMAAAQTQLVIVQLTNPASTCNQTAIAEWMTVWKQLVALTPNGGLYSAGQATDLLPVYHAIVRDLTGATESSALAEAAAVPDDQALVVDVPVLAELASMTLVILKSEPATTALVEGPQGAPLEKNATAITVTADGDRQEIWRFERPVLGQWQVTLSGQGEVTVWQDRVPLPTLVPTPTPVPTATPIPTATPTPLPTATPTASATPTLTATPTATPIPTATATPVPTVPPTPTATATPTAVMIIETVQTPRQPLGRGWWIFLVGVVGVSSAGGGALLWRRHHRYGLTGQLLILQGPTDEPNPLPYDLGRKRTRRLGLGRQGKGIWRLPGWSGSAHLLVDAQGMVLLAPEVRGGQAEEASVMLNGMAIYQPTILQDKDRIGCGPYQLQYENLLL